MNIGNFLVSSGLESNEVSADNNGQRTRRVMDQKRLMMLKMKDSFTTGINGELPDAKVITPVAMNSTLGRVYIR